MGRKKKNQKTPVFGEFLEIFFKYQDVILKNISCLNYIFKQETSIKWFFSSWFNE